VPNSYAVEVRNIVERESRFHWSFPRQKTGGSDAGYKNTVGEYAVFQAHVFSLTTEIRAFEAVCHGIPTLSHQLLGNLA